MSIVGAILAGGNATRFGGTAKGLAAVDDVRLIDRVANALGTVCDALLLIANAPDASAWLPGVALRGDVRAGCGALGGVHAALSHAGGEVLVVAWDMPFVSSALLATLRDAPGDAALARTDHGPEPLCARYSASCLAVADELLDAGERRARAIAEHVATTWIDCDPMLVLSVNTPDDLARAQSLARVRVSHA